MITSCTDLAALFWWICPPQLIFLVLIFLAYHNSVGHHWIYVLRSAIGQLLSSTPIAFDCITSYVWCGASVWSLLMSLGPLCSGRSHPLIMAALSALHEIFNYLFWFKWYLCDIYTKGNGWFCPLDPFFKATPFLYILILCAKPGR